MVHVSVRQNRPEPVERNSYPHPDNPGLIPQLDGFYDWAGRRLFLPNGSPDPATPGAYRYQTRPDLCDVGAPDSDPASPRYEPPHLRHRPGDTFEIGGKPHDLEDPGPYGTPGWRPDRRTGRHRRGELPDPIPPWEQPDRDPVADHRPSPIPRRRSLGTEPEEPYRFSKLREDAWDRWLVDSAPLAAAHDRRPRDSSVDGGFGPTMRIVIRLVRWISATCRGSRSDPAPSVSPGREPSEVASLRRRPDNVVHPSARPYIAAWERAFDADHAFGGVS